MMHELTNLELRKKTSALFLIHILFIMVLSGTDNKIQNIYYSLHFCVASIEKVGCLIG